MNLNFLITALMFVGTAILMLVVGSAYARSNLHRRNDYLAGLILACLAIVPFSLSVILFILSFPQ